MKKKYVSLLCAVLFAFCFISCNKNTETNTLVPNPTTAPQETITQEAIPTLKVTATPAPTEVPTVTPTPTPEPTKALTREPFTGLNAFELVDKIAVGWNLGNTLDCEADEVSFDSTPAKAVTAWGNEEPTLAMFEAVKAAGFNAVRIPITWYQHMKYDEATDTYIINEEWMDYVKKVVDYAYYLDFIVIINTHHEAWYLDAEYTEETFIKSAKMLQTIWERVAEEFADYDQALIFESMNEPRETGLGSDIEWEGGRAEGRKYINDLNQVFVDTVRAQGSKANQERALLLPTYAADSDIKTLEGFEIPDNAGNVIMSVHAYEPYTFTMTGDNPVNFRYPGISTWDISVEDQVNALFDNLGRITKEKNIPIIIGEFAASDNENTEDRVRWVTHYLTRAKELGIACFWWDCQNVQDAPGDEFGLLHRKSGRWYVNAIPVVQAMMDLYERECTLPEFKFPERTGFSWDNIPIEDDWKEMFYLEKGQKIDSWGSVRMNLWVIYLKGNHEIVVVYDSNQLPKLILQDGNHYVESGSHSENAYMLSFSMDDINHALDRERILLKDIKELYVGTMNSPMTLYGVYAVPIK